MKTNEIIKLKVGEKHTIELKGGGTKGHQWVAFPETNKVISTERKYSEKGINKKLLGSSANEIFTITALGKGKTTLKIKQIESWKESPKSINEHVCKIVVD